jgi:hypothetical protein
MKPFRTYRIPFVPSLVAREGDDDEEKKFTERFNKLFHAGMSERDKRDAPKRKKELDEALAAFATAQTDAMKNTIAEALKGFKPEPPPEPGDDKGKKKNEGGGDPETKAALARMQKAIDEANAKNEALMKSIADEKAKADAADSRARKQEEMQLVTQLLTEGKVRPNILRMAAEDIHKRFIAREKNEDGSYGEIRWRGENDELVDPKDPKKGLPKYLATDEGKELLPAVNAGGGGTRKPGTGGGGSGGGEFGFEQLGNKILGGR